ncbi:MULTISPECIES: hypothetical protein [unclassified Novosphingobium]|uniref:hypothetical protein n=1 Tax=unclassified Novosphingobium TaxID=2644732 RepID=UPI0014487787|nr:MULTISPECIES: hypothetical protein [unclassified Novosphingobium]NKJ42202.1 hypothetical protein [Novosphingobium sp. SG720]NMN04587.1 hypothetical protein [Novosphingobium sp. SG919]NMN85420.1 hypothetical protein [Novosphingobium sp. SG916]
MSPNRVHRQLRTGALVALSALALAAPAARADDAPAVARTPEQQAAAWQEIARQPDFWQGTWQSINPIADDFSTPPDYTPFARDYIAKYKPAEDSPFTNCKPLGMPFVQNIGGMPMKFFQSPGMIALYIETSGMTRFIHTDGRQHSEMPNPSYLGESIGHWEGGTLVVDTTGLAPDTVFQIGRLTNDVRVQGDHSPLAGVVFGPHGPNLRLVERMRLLDFNTLEIQTTIYDDTIFKSPYALPPRKFIRGIERRNEPQEWACTDNRDYLDPDTGKLEVNVKDKAQDR